MDYRDKLYSVYVSTHTSRLYSQEILPQIEAQFSTWRQYFYRFLPEDKNARLLDIGCGNGGFVYFLQQLGYAMTEGVELSEEQVEASRKLAIQQIVCADLTVYLSDKHEVFDAIFARDVIEHFNKDEVLAIFSAVLKALKPNGVFIIQAPNGESPMSGRIMYGDFTHELSFTKSSLNQIFLVSGFQAINCYPAGPVPKGYKSIIRTVLWKAIESILRLYVLIETGSSNGIFTQNIIAAGIKMPKSMRETTCQIH